MAADSAIHQLEVQINTQVNLIDLLQQETRNLINQTQLQNEFIVQSQSDLEEIKKGIADLKDLPEKKIPFWKQDWFLILVGSLAIVGMVR